MFASHVGYCRWLQENGQTSPMTGKPLQHSYMAPNHVVKRMVNMDQLGDSNWDNSDEAFYE